MQPYLIDSNRILLVVKRFVRPNSHRTVGFQVLKVENELVQHCEKLEDDQALFLSEVCSELVCSPFIPADMKSCICFLSLSNNNNTDYHLGFFKEGRMIRANMAEKSQDPPIWIMPWNAYDCNCPCCAI